MVRHLATLQKTDGVSSSALPKMAWVSKQLCHTQFTLFLSALKVKPSLSFTESQRDMTFICCFYWGLLQGSFCNSGEQSDSLFGQVVKGVESNFYGAFLLPRCHEKSLCSPLERSEGLSVANLRSARDLRRENFGHLS